MNTTMNVRLQGDSGNDAPGQGINSAAPAAAAASPATGSERAPRLLIVDDDASAVALLQRALAPLGELCFALTGADALLLARQQRPDLILLDCRIPEPDGYAVCAMLKADPAFQHVPILFVSQLSDPVDEQRAFDAGGADCIAKPFDPRVVRVRVGHHLASARRARERLRAARESWRELSDHRVAELLRGRSVAEAANRNKSLMLSSIAHEIGNPLNGVLVLGELMAADAAEPLPPAQARRLALMMTAAQQLQDLMRDLTDLGGLEVGRLQVSLQALAVPACIEAAAAALTPVAEQRGITIERHVAQALPPVLADHVRLRQCLVNLVSNATKYNRPGGWVRVGAALHGQRVSIRVEDNGIGMAREQLEHLFEPFNRLGRQAHAAGGAGLGMAITKHLVDAMGGTLAVSSAPRAGTQFTITLPVAPPADAGIEAPQRAADND